MNVDQKRVLDYQDTKALLLKYGIPFAKGQVVSTKEEAVNYAQEIGYPVALKVLSPHLPHKMDAGALALGIKSRHEVVESYQRIMENALTYNPEATIEGVLVQEYVQGGMEVMVGMVEDSLFGPVIVFGLGGVFVEILKDLSMAIPPLTPIIALEMIEGIKGYPILQGYRNKPKVDLLALQSILMKFSTLILENRHNLSEVDLNPIVVLGEGQGAKVVDMLFFAKG